MKQALTFGGIAGGLIILYTFIVYFTFGDFGKITPEELPTIEALGYLRYVILIAVIIFAIRVFKKNSESAPSYWALVKQGVFTALVVAVCVGLMEAVYMAINPAFFAQYGQLKLDEMIASNAPAEEIAQFKQDMEDYAFMASPLVNGVFYFFETAILGSVLSLIVALFFRPSKTNPNLATS